MPVPLARFSFFFAAAFLFACLPGCQPDADAEKTDVEKTGVEKNGVEKPGDEKKTEVKNPDSAAGKSAVRNPSVKNPTAEKPAQTSTANDADGWKSLFDGKSLGDWKLADYAGTGKVHVEDGAIVLDAGASMTGIAWKGGDMPKSNYEITLEGRRLDGDDFFCTTTFRVGDAPCSFVVGGWGGSLVGLSSIDRRDASENSTSKLLTFEKNRWYRIRIRVTDHAVQTWIDDALVVDQPREDHQFSIRVECGECQPLGICTWETQGAVRNIKIRDLPVKTTPK
jgi:hypothetical protein